LELCIRLFEFKLQLFQSFTFGVYVFPQFSLDFLQFLVDFTPNGESKFIDGFFVLNFCLELPLLDVGQLLLEGANGGWIAHG